MLNNLTRFSVPATVDPSLSPIAREICEAQRLLSETPDKIVIFDTETIGLSPRFDQIRQFAAISTYDLINPDSGEDALDLTCRLRPEVIPSPQALLITRVWPDEFDKPELSHPEMMAKVEDYLRAAAPAIYAGHNVIRFDSEHIRHNLFASLLAPYPLQAPGCRLFDTLQFAHLIFCLRPDAVIWPKRADGKPVFRLGELARALGIAFDEADAHDALADVRATRDLMLCLRERNPDLYALAMALTDKGYVGDLLGRCAVIARLGVYGGVSSVMPLTSLSRDPTNPNASLMVDLRIDPETYLDLSEANLAALLDGRTSPVRSVKHNAMPLVVPLSLTDPLAPEAASTLHKLDHSEDAVRADDLLQRRAARLRENSGFIERVRDIRRRQFAAREVSPYVEERLYTAFPGYADLALGRKFHDTAIDERAALITLFRDERLRIHATRLVFEEAPETLDPGTRQDMEQWLSCRLTTEEDVPWLTLPVALRQTEDLHEALVEAADAEACKHIPDPPPIIEPETGAQLPDNAAILEVEHMRLAFIEEHLGSSLSLLDDYADWLRHRLDMLPRT